MSDLVAFLSARLDEDEALAKSAAGAAGPEWIRDRMVTASGATTGITSPDGTVLADTLCRDDEEVAPHIARHDPARVLREVAARRAILEEHHSSQSSQPSCSVCHAGGFDWDPEDWPCLTVRALAAVYSDHPDFDPAWAPLPVFTT